MGARMSDKHAERRAAKAFKDRHGMKVTNTSIRLIAVLVVSPKRKKGAK
jgi:hypothetical protein